MFCRSIGLIGLQRTGRQIRQIQSFKHTTVLERNLSAPTKLETVFLDPSPKSSPYVLSKEQELKITKNNHGRSLKLSELLLKLYMKREQGFWLPKEMRLEDLELMLELYGQKLDKYLLLVNKRCKYDSEFQEKKKESQEVRAELTKIREATPEEHPWLTYHLFGNALFPRMYKRSWVATYNLHMARALQMGQKIVIDCGYDEFMGDHQIKNLARQIIMCLGINLANKRPFAMYLCQLMKEGKLMYYLRRLNPLIEVQPNIVLHSGSYFDLFEKKKLVYLTPHTHLPLQYDPDDIFIIGGIVDRDKSLQLSSKKAAKEGIRYACFPLDQHLKWRKGSKLLCVHHSFNILLDLKNTRDWGKALNASVPRRHLNP